MFEAISLFLKSGKCLFYVGFAVLIAFVLIGGYCHHKPDVTVINSTPIEPKILENVTNNIDTTIQEDQQKSQETAKTANDAQQALDQTHLPKTTVSSSKSKSSEPCSTVKIKDVRETGEKQIEVLQDLYKQYYG